MFNRTHQPKDLFTEGYNSLQWSVLIFGAALITLAVLIFLYPALLGFLFATLILFIGIAAVIGGYRLYRFKKHLEKVEKEGEPFAATIKTEGPHYRYRSFTMIVR
ncbi:hypothetical protein [Nitrospina gracilis]|uniref:hypothetical protein n=1 Tax=Nitrospina gracilis TaxID=35801 RepID=UPI001F392AD2|nr:hypothetical protein [Nitrospina gracilis]MCF8720082.1 uncharacterized membrane protein HdeD (DUF308 family) [Nitrospina gracilis Nb-211]